MNVLELNNVSHFLFDYDGLLVDSEKLYFETWCLVLTEEGQQVCHEYHEGKHESEVYEKVKRYLKEPMSLEEVSLCRKTQFDKLTVEGKLELIKGMKQLLEVLSSIAPMSIVSNSTIDVVKEGLLSTGVHDYFGNLFCYSTKVNRKPSPDLYNLAVDSLSLEKSTIWALEDSKSGILSAQEAGVPVICINPTSSMKNFCTDDNVPYFSSVAEFLAKIS